MDRHRQIAFISAFIVALIIMMLGKSCTDSMMKKQSKPVQNNVSQTSPAYENNGYNNNYSNNYINGYNNTPPQTTIPQQTEVPAEYVTNMFGEVVGTAETPVTDFPETQADDIQTTTQQRSILEQYNEEKQKDVSPYMNTPAENNNYQIPSEINITIH